MIRRTTRDEQGAECWVLISQVEHARISGVLAGRWDPSISSQFDFRDELLAAIYHHDDGWADWEQAIGVDPETGRPLNFTEMPLVESLAIWRDSIAAASRHGDLAGYVVSAHFCSLLHRFSSRWQNDAVKAAIAGEFFESQKQHQADRLAAWNRRVKVPDVGVAADAALKMLQIFDSLSLWLCCSEHPEPETLEPPGAPAATIRSLAPFKATISPWPFADERIELEAVGRLIPATRYESPAELALAPSRQAALKWTILGGLGKKA
ncbi:MAG TPA: DUF3891 family protein [Pirellulales bacterium]|nr:DUF3891 family protein [Pirellulales bacterium]